jgi:hypothetical protein
MGKIFRGEQAAKSSRKLSYAEVAVTYAGVVAERPVKGANAGVDSSAPIPTKDGAPDECKRRRDLKISRIAPLEAKNPTGAKDVTVCSTAGGHLVTDPAAAKKARGPLKLTTNGSVILPVTVASMEATLRRTSPGAQ